MFSKIKKVICNPIFWLILVLILGVGIRFYNVPKMVHMNDLKFFQDWTSVSLENGITNVYNFYEGKESVDYPPVYLYVLTGMGYLSKNVFNINPDTFQFEYFIKSLNILIDLLTAVFIYKIVKKISSKTYATASFMAFFLNPYVIYVSTVWGQVDNLISFFTILAIYLYVSRLKILSFSSIVVGLLTKFQIIIISPLLFLHFLFNEKFKSLLKAIVVALFTLVLVILPFILSGNLSQVTYTYTNSTGRYPFISMNAYNLWWIFSNPEVLLAVSSDTPLKDLTIYPTYKESPYLKGELLSSKNLAYLLFFSVYILLCINVYIKKDIKNLFFSMAIGTLAFFILNVQMHERYLFPFFALFSLIFFQKPKYIASFILITIFGWINLMFVFSPNSLVTDFRNLTYPTLSYYVSVINVIVLLVLLSDVVKNIFKWIVVKKFERMVKI